MRSMISNRKAQRHNRNLKALRTILLLISCLLCMAQLQHPSAAALTAVDAVLQQSRAKYAALKSYADKGTVTTEYKDSGSSDQPAVENHTFSTSYRAPRQFFFEFKKDPNVADERFVIWSDGGDFNTWWSATKVHETYPKGQGAQAFALGAFPTKNSAMQIPPLLFAQAGLHGPTVDFNLSISDQTEEVAGNRCHKLVGEVGLAYGTGTVTNIRPTTIWIDAESLLVRKILEDTPKDEGGTNRVTTTFDPQADPKVDDSRFKFAPPQ